MIKTLIFDLDGTLIDSKEDIAHSVNRTLDALGLPTRKLEVIYSMIGEGVYRLISQALEGHEERVKAGIRIFRTDYKKHLLDTTACYQGIEAVMDCFKGRFLAIVTNKPREFTIPILEGLGIRNRFNLIISGDDGWPKKPAPDAICEIMKESAVSGSEAIHIGDHYTDILAGKNAGTFTCWAAYGFGQRRDLIPDLTINSPLDLLTMIK